ncbi:MAG: hypothetical protein ACJ76F_00705 [Bacteroidia bacterium]
MKKTAVFISAIAGTLFFSSCGPTQKDATAYNDKLVAIEKSATDIHNMYIDQLDGHNPDSLKMIYEQFSAKVKASEEECKNMEDFNKKKDFADAAAAYFATMGGLLQKEGKEMTEIAAKDSSQITEADITKFNELVTKFDEVYGKSLEKVQAAQTAFAKEWKFEVKTE